MNRSILVFDGVCVLCSGWVRFVMRRDPQGRYAFAALQTAAGRRLLADNGLDPDDPLSFLLIEDGRAHTDSDAIIRVLRSFGPGWSVAAALIRCVPRGPRDAIYRWVARNRYRLFGRRETCLVPRPEDADRFVE